jgi:hypothetical protein
MRLVNTAGKASKERDMVWMGRGIQVNHMGCSTHVVHIVLAFLLGHSSYELRGIVKYAGFTELRKH